MDIALCKIEGNKVNYSGANRPLLIIRNDGALEEIKPTKCAIGGFTTEEQQFEEHSVMMSSGDSIYLLTDGLSDQFGGDKNKKMTTKKLKQYLTNNHKNSMPEQGNKLERFFKNWKGAHEQIDDVLVIGIKFS